MGHEEYKEMLELAALDALDEDGSGFLQRHLETCAECKVELAELRDTAATLVYLTPPAQAPAELRARVLDAIKVSGMSSSLDLGAADDDDEGEARRGADEPMTVTTKVVPLLSGRRRWSTSSWVGAVAASIIFAILVVAIIVLWDRNREMQAELARLSKNNEEMQSELTRLSQRNNEMRNELASLTNPQNEAQPQTDLPPVRDNAPEGETPEQRAARESNVNEQPIIAAPSITEPPLTAEPDARVVALAGTDQAPQAHARLVYNSRTGVITLSVSGLPTQAAGKAYQLWYMVKGRPIPGAVFSTGPGGRAMMRGPMPAEARSATAFAVTLENQNGSNKPTGAKYLLGAVS